MDRQVNVSVERATGQGGEAIEMLDDEKATRLVNGLVFAVQKSRSDIMEAWGEPLGEDMLANLHPLLFGEGSAMPRLLAWQARCRESGTISGLDLHNWFMLIERSESSAALALLFIHGYAEVEEVEAWPSVGWMGQTYKYGG